MPSSPGSSSPARSTPGSCRSGASRASCPSPSIPASTDSTSHPTAAPCCSRRAAATSSSTGSAAGDFLRHGQSRGAAVPVPAAEHGGAPRGLVAWRRHHDPVRGAKRRRGGRHRVPARARRGGRARPVRPGARDRRARRGALARRDEDRPGGRRGGVLEGPRELARPGAVRAGLTAARAVDLRRRAAGGGCLDHGTGAPRYRCLDAGGDLAGRALGPHRRRRGDGPGPRAVVDARRGDAVVETRGGLVSPARGHRLGDAPGLPGGRGRGGRRQPRDAARPHRHRHRNAVRGGGPVLRGVPRRGRAGGLRERHPRFAHPPARGGARFQRDGFRRGARRDPGDPRGLPPAMHVLRER